MTTAQPGAGEELSDALCDAVIHATVPNWNGEFMVNHFRALVRRMHTLRAAPLEENEDGPPPGPIRDAMVAAVAKQVDDMMMDNAVGCRPEDRAMLQTDAGKELMRAASAAMATPIREEMTFDQAYRRAVVEHGDSSDGDSDEHGIAKRVWAYALGRSTDEGRA